RVDHELEAVRLARIAKVAVQPDREFEVFPDRVGSEAAYCREGAASENPEGAGDRDEATDVAHRRTSGDEGPGVLEHLPPGDEVSRGTCLYNGAVDYLCLVDHPDGPA